MNRISTNIAGSIAALVLIAVTGIRPAHADLDAYLSAPDQTTSQFTNTTVESFDELSTGTYSSPLTTSIGTYQLGSNDKLAVMNNDQYGDGSKYAAFGAESGTSGSISLSLAAPASYFGFEWCAGDANNAVSIYNNDTLVGRFSTATLLTMLSTSTVTAVNGSTYKSSTYFGQPGTGKDAGEPFGFVNIIDTTGTFNRVVFDNSGTTGTGFETDNHTVSASAPTPLGSFVNVGTVPVPEPSAFGLLSTGLLGALGIIRRRKA